MNWSIWLFLSCVFCGLAVLGGAFGAHFLKNRLTHEDLQIFETAIRYQMYHGLALIGIAFASSQLENIAIKIAGWSFVLGIFIFSGSLFILVATGLRWLGAITPIGGLSLIFGWISLAWALISK